MDPTNDYESLDDNKSKWSKIKDVLIHTVPILEWLPAFDWKENGVKEITCGLTVGCILIAQSLAHAKLCGVSVIHGPYSCILPPVVYAVFGSCHEASVGTGSIVALLVGSALQDYATEEERTMLAPILSLEVGIILTLMGVFKLSFLVRFLSNAALSGFITASAITIIKSMLGPMLGLPAELAKNLVTEVAFKPWNLQSCNAGSTGLSVGAVIFFLLLGESKKRKYCGSTILKMLARFKELIVLILGSAFCYYYATILEIEVIGNVPQGMPPLSSPLTPQTDIHVLKELLPSALLVAIVVFISSWSSAKATALTNHYHVAAFNELVALGLANVSGAFTASVPTQIGLSRSALAQSLGVKSQIGSGIVVAMVVYAVVQCLAPFLYFVPSGILNTIIAFAATSLFEFTEAHQLYKLGAYKDCFIWFVAFFGTIWQGCLNGILVSVCLSMFLVMYQVVEPNVSVLGRRAVDEQWLKVDFHEDAEQLPGVLVFRVEGPVFYANIESLQETIHHMETKAYNEGNPISMIVMSASSIAFVDTTALKVLREMIKAWKERKIQFHIANAYGETEDLITQILEKDLEPGEDVSATIASHVQKFTQKPKPYRRKESVRGLPGFSELPHSDTIQ